MPDRVPGRLMRSVVELDAIRVTHGDRTVLDLPVLGVRQEEILAIMGPNGSGKSTLLRVLGLLEAPTAGAVRFRGAPVTARDGLGVRRRMASVFQEPLLADAPVFDNVALGLRFRSVDSRRIRPRVDVWLDRFRIAHLASRQARTLSGGEAQRAALARALVVEPELLLLDEPFSALDQPTREELMNDLGRILSEERTTAVLVTHDRAEAMVLGDRVGVLMAAASSGRRGGPGVPARRFPKRSLASSGSRPSSTAVWSSRPAVSLFSKPGVSGSRWRRRPSRGNGCACACVPKT
jgi:tungstate transport system ATP-binding protein